MTPPKDDELLPCPFCGGRAEVFERGNDYTKKRSAVVSCTKCKTDGRRCAAIRHPMTDCVKWAIEAWNTRAADARSAYAVERAVKILDKMTRAGPSGASCDTTNKIAIRRDLYLEFKKEIESIVRGRE